MNCCCACPTPLPGMHHSFRPETNRIMSSRTAICLQPANATLGEGPVWDARRNVLWRVDIKQQKLLSFQPDCTVTGGKQIGQRQLPGQIGCLGLWADDRISLALEDGIYGLTQPLLT